MLGIQNSWEVSTWEMRISREWSLSLRYRHGRSVLQINDGMTGSGGGHSASEYLTRGQAGRILCPLLTCGEFETSLCVP